MPPRLDNTSSMLLPRYAKKCLACVSCHLPIEKLPNGSLLHPYLGWKEWQWWNCATQNGIFSPERPPKNSGVLKGSFLSTLNKCLMMFPLSINKGAFVWPKMTGLIEIGETVWGLKIQFSIEVWKTLEGKTCFVHKLLVFSCATQAMLRHMVNWAHGHPAPPQARTKRVLGYKMESR